MHGDSGGVSASLDPRLAPGHRRRPPGVRPPPVRVIGCPLGLLLACLSAACDPDLTVGKWNCGSALGVPDAGADVAAPATDPVPVPWTTGFEGGFCDYARVNGFCVANPGAGFDIVTAPVHSGKRAAAFSVTSDVELDGLQARCVREGALPDDGVYGAWYYVPAAATNADNWNLMHFRSPQQKLWDVSLGNTDGGGLALYVFDFLRSMVRASLTAPEIPIGSWFHLEFHWLRSLDASGEVALYQDGQLVLEARGIITDVPEPELWYVGNLANALTPPATTVYVDDVSIRAAP